MHSISRTHSFHVVVLLESFDQLFLQDCHALHSSLFRHFNLLRSRRTILAIVVAGVSILATSFVADLEPRVVIEARMAFYGGFDLFDN